MSRKAAAFLAALLCVFVFAVHAIPPNQQVGEDRFHFHVPSHSGEMESNAAELALAAARGALAGRAADAIYPNPVPAHGGVVADQAAAGRTKWPELVGTSWEHARTVLTAAGKHAQMVHQGSAVTMDFREDRVRVFVNSQQVVVAEPRIG